MISRSSLFFSLSFPSFINFFRRYLRNNSSILITITVTFVCSRRPLGVPSYFRRFYHIYFTCFRTFNRMLLLATSLGQPVYTFDQLIAFTSHNTIYSSFFLKLLPNISPVIPVIITSHQSSLFFLVATLIHAFILRVHLINHFYISLLVFNTWIFSRYSCYYV